jgi:peptide/nickel transport system permease protein
MLRFTFHRLLALVPVLLGVTLVVFLAVQLIPGSKIGAVGGFLAGADAQREIEAYFGFDRPAHEQYFVYMGRLLQGDLGYAYSRKREVSAVLGPAVGNSLALALSGLLLALLVGLFVGYVAALLQGSILDRVLVSTLIVVGTAPPFWLALILVLVFSVQLQWFPATGMYGLRGDPTIGQLLHHLVLPTIAVAAQPAAIIAKVTRVSMLEIKAAEFVTALRARGLPRRRVFLRHILRNALSPVVTITGLQLGYLVGGVVFVEVVFSWPGVGFQLYQAVLARDIPLVMGASLVIALVFVLVNLVADVANALLDPRLQAD